MTDSPGSTEDRRTWLTIQTILYGNDPEDLLRSGESLARSLEIAVQRGLVSRSWWRIGDCSPNPLLTEAHLEVLRQLFEPLWCPVEVQHFDGQNLGHGGGHNRLFGLLGTPTVLIANPDLVFAPDTISALSGRADPRIGLIDARQIPLEHPKAHHPVTGVTGWASGACVLARTELIHEVGGFDESSFFLYCDDVDLSWRARLAGYGIVTEPTARVFHDKRLNDDGHISVSDAERYYSAEGALILAHKYSRPDVVESIVAGLLDSPESDHHQAVAEFRRRRDAGQLPAPIDHDHAVAEFVGGAYTTHRF